MEQTRPIKFFVSGQVDCGKSTLIGYILFHTANRLALDPASHDATKYSDLLDVDQSERERGNTQFSSVNPFTWNGISFEAIDTPGHLIYIRELINSISENKGSIGCLIISAIYKEFTSMFENGTTKEDTILMRSCGINHIIVLINKIDKPQTDVDGVVDAFNKWVTKLGFKSITFVPISGFHGLNVFERINHSAKCFIETLVEVHAKIKYNPLNQARKELTTRVIKLRFQSFDIVKIIAVGYKSIFHIVEGNTNEMEGEITKIKHPDTTRSMPFFRGNSCVILHVTLQEEVTVFEHQRFILRDAMTTIGFGTVIKGHAAPAPCGANVAV